MSRRVLIFTPSGDPSLVNSRVVADWTVKRLREAGHELAVRADWDAERAAFVDGSGVGGFALFAHGDEWTVFGQSGTPALDGSNVAACAGAWVWAYACRTGVELGPRAIAAGATRWVGFFAAVHVDWIVDEIPVEVAADFEALATEVPAQLAAAALDEAALRLRIRQLGEAILEVLDDTGKFPDAVGIQLSVQQLVDHLQILPLPPR